MMYYLPIEPYPERYTWQLRDWTEARLREHGIPFKTLIPSMPTTEQITTGSILDYWTRTRYALLQTELLVAALQQDGVDDQTVIYFQDMFHPGIEALPYIFDQMNVHPRVFMQNCAQSMDVYDFTHGMMRWMRRYEQMVVNAGTHIFVASAIHKELMCAAEFESTGITVTGLPFDIDEVRSRAGALVPWQDRAMRVVFTSRMDAEKQPEFFILVARHVREVLQRTDIEFAFVCGGAVKSNNRFLADVIKAEREAGRVAVYDHCSKERYYDLLKNSRVQFNCALQDFVSNTLNEASALHVPSIVPCFRGFPEIVRHADQLYNPWDVEQAAERIVAYVDKPSIDIGVVESPARISHATLDKVITAMRLP